MGRPGRPLAYQQISGSRRTVDVRFVMTRDGNIGFALGAYDRRSRSRSRRAKTSDFRLQTSDFRLAFRSSAGAYIRCAYSFTMRRAEKRGATVRIASFTVAIQRCGTFARSRS